MKGMMVRGVAGLAVALGLAACTNDDTVNAGGDFNTVQANPASLFVSINDSTEVLVRLIDDLNRSTPTKFTVSNVGAGIVVNYDVRYRPDYTQGDTLVVPEIKPQQRYYVVGRANGLHEFTLTSGSASTVVRVYVTPDNLGAALSRTTGVAGDLVTITAAPGTRFSTTAGALSAVTFPSGPAPIVTARAADGSTITILVGPGVGGVATVTNVSYLFAPAAPAVTLSTTNTLTIPPVAFAPTTLSTGTPTLGQAVTVTLGGGLRFTAAGAVLIGGVPAFITARTADSTSLTVVARLGSTGAVTYTGVVLSFLPSVLLTLPSDGKTIVPGAGIALPGGTDIATAAVIALPTAVGQTVVVTDVGPYGAPGFCGGVLGGDTCRIYQIVVPATQTFTFEGNWNTNADIGFYRVSAAGGFQATIGDALGQSATRTENGTLGALAAGTYYIAVAYYGASSYGPGVQPQPTQLQMRFTRTL